MDWLKKTVDWIRSCWIGEECEAVGRTIIRIAGHALILVVWFYLERAVQSAMQDPVFADYAPYIAPILLVSTIANVVLLCLLFISCLVLTSWRDIKKLNPGTDSWIVLAAVLIALGVGGGAIFLAGPHSTNDSARVVQPSPVVRDDRPTVPEEPRVIASFRLPPPMRGGKKPRQVLKVPPGATHVGLQLSLPVHKNSKYRWKLGQSGEATEIEVPEDGEVQLVVSRRLLKSGPHQLIVEILETEEGTVNTLQVHDFSTIDEL